MERKYLIEIDRGDGDRLNVEPLGDILAVGVETASEGAMIDLTRSEVIALRNKLTEWIGDTIALPATGSGGEVLTGSAEPFRPLSPELLGEAAAYCEEEALDLRSLLPGPG